MSGGEPLQEVPAAPWKKKVGFTTFFIWVVHGLRPDDMFFYGSLKASLA
jgi:hypothetical protein